MRKTVLPAIAKGWRRPRNKRCWAIGVDTPQGFHVRRVVWGKLMAMYERRPGEVAVPCLLSIAPKTTASRVRRGLKLPM